MKRFAKDNALSLVLFGFFLATLFGLGLTGWSQENEELAAHQQAAISLTAYIRSGGFIEAVFENWESEFLQMGALVLLTVWLRQKGAPDSKKLQSKEKVDTSSRYAIIRARGWKRRQKGMQEALFANSLSIALFGLFFIAFILHALGGVSAFNEEALQHGETTITVWQYVASSRFWYESFQNWQSEFLSVATLIVLSVFLRQRNSPESKPVGAPNSATGS